MSGETVSILLAIFVILFSLCLIGFLIGNYVYKRKHNLPTGDCAYCKSKKNKLLKDYHKLYGNKH